MISGNEYKTPTQKFYDRKDRNLTQVKWKDVYLT